MLKHFVCVLCGCRKKLEEAASLNNDIMPSFWLHKWPRTPKSDPSSVGITVWGYCHVTMDSILICSNTLHMSDVDAGSKLRWLSGSTATKITSFWLHKYKWPRTPKSDPSSMGMTVRGYCHMSMNSILMFSNTLYMSNVDAGSSLRLLSASTMMLWHHFDYTSNPEPQNLT